jgi:Ca-activated chloride channel family protein
LSRHAAPRNNRWRWIAPIALLAIGALVAVVVLAGSTGGKASAGSVPASPTAPKSPANPCPTRLPLRVVAASGIAPVVRSVAAKTCVDATVTVNDSATAASLLRQGKADVWIPDSRVRAVLAGSTLSAAAPSLAVSPLVIAANATSNISKWSTTSPLSWSALLDQGSLSPLSVEVQNSSTSSTSLVLASALNGLALTSTGDKYLGLASVAAASTSMKPATTTDISSSTLRIEEARLVKGQSNAEILPMAGGYPQLDYPWLARTGSAPAVRTANDQLLKALQGPLGDAARTQQGLLKPGAATVEPTDYAGTSGGALIPVPAAASVPTLYAIADAGAQHGNTLAVLDISGSMAEPTSAGQESKIAAVQSSAKLAAALLSPQTRLGLWEFTYQLEPPNDYRQVVPLAALADNRSTLLDAVSAATPIPTGGTSLYRTTLDAYKYVQANWKANYANTVIVFTDGKDETDPGAPSLTDVQSQLKSAADPKRPIQLIMLGYGEADIASMNALTGTVGGVVYHITSAAQIVGAFIDSISQSVLHSLGSA